MPRSCCCSSSCRRSSTTRPTGCASAPTQCSTGLRWARSSRRSRCSSRLPRVLAWAFSDVSLLVALPIIVLASLPLVQIANVAPHLVGARERCSFVARRRRSITSMLVWFLAVLWRSAFVAMQPGPRRFVRSRSQGHSCSPFRCSYPPACCPKRAGGRNRAQAPALDATNPASEPVLALQRELQERGAGRARGPARRRNRPVLRRLRARRRRRDVATRMSRARRR